MRICLIKISRWAIGWLLCSVCCVVIHQKAFKVMVNVGGKKKTWVYSPLRWPSGTVVSLIISYQISQIQCGLLHLINWKLMCCVLCTNCFKKRKRSELPLHFFFTTHLDEWMLLGLLYNTLQSVSCEHLQTTMQDAIKHMKSKGSVSEWEVKVSSRLWTNDNNNDREFWRETYIKDSL